MASFENKSLYEPPDEDKDIWRYVGYPKFNWILQSGQLHFHQTSDMRDPYEGEVPKAIKQLLLSKGGSENLDIFLDMFEQARYISFLNCWHLGDSESAAMWDLYGRSDRSIAIKSTVGDLADALIENNNFPFTFGEVSYMDYKSGLYELDDESLNTIEEKIINRKGMNTKQVLHIKRDSFRHEKEGRVQIQFISLIAQDYEEIQEMKDYQLPFGLKPSENVGFGGFVPDKSGFNVDIEIDDLINEIYIAPDAPDWVVSSIKSTLANRTDLDLGFTDVIQSELYDPPRE